MAVKTSKIIISVLMLYALGGLSAMPITASSIPESYTDGITLQGQVRRINFHLLIVDDQNVQEWHYFGSTAAEFPPTNGAPVFEHPTVQLPNDFDDLGPDSDSAVMDLAILAGVERDGLPGATNVFTGGIETQGTTKIAIFKVWDSGTWYYFGYPDTDPVPDGGLSGPIIALANIQFPRDFGELGDEEALWLYEMAFQIGLKREGLE